jgi:hypothetical protein
MKQKNKKLIFIITSLVLYNIKFIFFLLTYSFLMYEYAEKIFYLFTISLCLILWLFIHIYVAICRSSLGYASYGFVNPSQTIDTNIKLPAPIPLTNELKTRDEHKMTPPPPPAIPPIQDIKGF